MHQTTKEKIARINAQYHDMLAPVYDTFKEQNHPKVLDFYKLLIKKIYKKYITDEKKTLKILDFGCGTGYLEQFLKPKQNKITGIDVSSKMLSLAKKKYPNVNYKKQDIYQFKAHEKFDLIVENSVLHHLKDYEEVLVTCSKLLKPSGVFFGGAEPNYYCYHYLSIFKFLIRKVLADKRTLKTKDIKESLEPLAEYHMYFSEGFNPYEFKNKLMSLGFSRVEIIFSSRELVASLEDRMGLKIIDWLPNWLMDKTGLASRQFYFIAQL